MKLNVNRSLLLFVVIPGIQRFADEMTITCTEWPTVDEIADVVLQEAKKYAKVDKWELRKYNKDGTVNGSFTVGDYKITPRIDSKESPGPRNKTDLNLLPDPHMPHMGRSLGE